MKNPLQGVKRKIGVILLLIAVITIITATATNNEMELEYMVSSGDSMVYEYKKVYQAGDVGDIGNDGDPNTYTFSSRTIDEENVDITIRKGSKFTITVMNVSYSYVTVRLSYPEGSWEYDISWRTTEFVAICMTMDNASYWQEYATKHSEIQSSGNVTNIQEYSVKGNYLIHNLTGILSEQIYFRIEERNWKTGWLTSLHEKFINSTTQTIIAEHHYAVSSQSLTALDSTSIGAGFCIAVLVIHLRQKIKH